MTCIYAIFRPQQTENNVSWHYFSSAVAIFVPHSIDGAKNLLTQEAPSNPRTHDHMQHKMKFVESF